MQAEQQIRAISSYIANGTEHGCGDCLGLELEHFIVDAKTHGYVGYFDDAETGRPGVGTILERLAPHYEDKTFDTAADGTQHLIGLARRYVTITLEPGAQFEVSIGPVFDLSTLEVLYQAFRAELDPLLEGYGYALLTIGYHPTMSARDIPLIPKERYRHMDEYFKATGRHGICMMRASASTQVSIDFTSEEDAICKFRIANALGPLLAFVCDNTPVFEGVAIGTAPCAPSGLPVPNRMARMAIWDDVDALRSMTAPFTFEEDFCFDKYAESLLKAPAVFLSILGDDGIKQNIYQGDRPFSEVFADETFSRETIEHILSLFFYDVRFKTYIEIRLPDSLPIRYALSFAALIKGLFYSQQNVDDLAEAFQYVDAASVAFAKTALRAEGYDALVYQRKAADWLDELFLRAAEGLRASDRPYLDPLAELVAQRRTLVDL